MIDTVESPRHCSGRYNFGHNSPAAGARELFKPSTDSVILLARYQLRSLVDVAECLEKFTYSARTCRLNGSLEIRHKKTNAKNVPTFLKMSEKGAPCQCETCVSETQAIPNLGGDGNVVLLPSDFVDLHLPCQRKRMCGGYRCELFSEFAVFCTFLCYRYHKDCCTTPFNSHFFFFFSTHWYMLEPVNSWVGLRSVTFAVLTEKIERSVAVAGTLMDLGYQTSQCWTLSKGEDKIWNIIFKFLFI